MAPENLAKYELSPIDYDQRDSSDFRLYWKYMPQFRVLDQNDFVRTMAVYLMLFIFIAIICFAAVIIIAYTRCLTIALANKQLYEDLRHLGASRDYLFRTARGQVSRVFITPCIVGTTGIFALYAMRLCIRIDSRFTFQELVGMGACLIIVLACTLVIYGVYRSAKKASLSSAGYLRSKTLPFGERFFVWRFGKPFTYRESPRYNEDTGYIELLGIGEEDSDGTG